LKFGSVELHLLAQAIPLTAGMHQQVELLVEPLAELRAQVNSNT
jgi:hypothetical protein